MVALPQALADQTTGLVGQIGELAHDAGVTLARITYTGAYFMAYAAVFSAVFVAGVLPKQNPIMEGFADGGRAAKDALEDQKMRKAKP